MSHTERLLRCPETFRRLTGLDPTTFHTLLPQVEQAWLDAQCRRRQRPDRRRRPGAGPKVALSVADQLLALPMYDRTRTLVPPDVARVGDTGYQGTALRTPVKRRRGQQLSRRQRRGNRRLSRRRIAAEHGIGKMKIWRIAGERYRNPVRRHTLVIKNVAGLHNLMFS